MSKTLYQLFSEELDEDLKEALAHPLSQGKEEQIFRIQLLRKVDSLIWAVEDLQKVGD